MLDKSVNGSLNIKSFEKIDFLSIGLIVSLMVAVVYQPFYFGDELIPWLVTGKNQGFIQSLLEYSGYKPRLIFNSLWIFFSSVELPRYVPSAIVAISQTVNAILIYKLINKISNDRLVSWLAVLAFLTNRFGVVIWYDYLSGIIESLSLCFFIAGLYLLHSDRITKLKIVFALHLFVFSVLVHERYGVAIFSVVLLSAFLIESLKPYRLYLMVVSVLPIAVFILLNQVVGENDIKMGTAGQEVKAGSKMLYSFITYLGNVFFHINYGKSWFFGALNLESIYGLIVSTASAIVLFVIYIYGLAFHERKINLKKAGIFFGCIIAFIAIASLPGTDRQEGRWLQPVAAMVIIFYAYIFSKNVLAIILLFLISLNSFYFFTGSLNHIANVGSAKIAHTVGTTLTSGAAIGNNGLIIGGGNDTSWAIGGGSALGHNTYSGDLFIKANSIEDMSILIQPDNKTYIDNGFDFALIRSEQNAHHSFVFKQYPISVARLILFPENLSSLKKVTLGKSGDWQSWIFSKKTETGGELLLTKGFDGFYEENSSKLHGNLIIYNGRKINDERTTMRIQINWMNARGEFIKAFIKVVELQKEAKEYSAFISAPADAVKGLVYATLHDDSSGSGVLESVSIGLIKDN